MGVRLTDIVFDRHEDFLYEDDRAMKLTSYVMAERCIQVEVAKIYNDKEEGDYSSLIYIIEGGFKGFHNMDATHHRVERRGPWMGGRKDSLPKPPPPSVPGGARVGED